ncbi:MAG TPA: vitamin K epoxide reductase family protein [Pyrinomonadaceae bacterium]|nr:vitamin K epoxide reductase family protein [Pyrinomonadaceae bacterium]
MSPRKAATSKSKVKPGSNAAPDLPKRTVYLFAAVALLSLVGLSDAIYLTVEHLAGRTVRCTITSGCEEVLTSSYATVGGFPLAGLGALAYFIAFSLAILAAFGNRRAGDLLLYVVALMLAVSVYLFILQAFVIHAFCQFCLLSAAVTLLLALTLAAERFYLRRK